MIACLVGEELQTAPKNMLKNFLMDMPSRFEKALVEQLDYKTPN